MWPILASLGAAVAIYLWRRSVGAIQATLLSLGVALLATLLLVLLTHGSSTFYDLGDSVVILLGLPLVVYVLMLAVLTKRARLSLPAAILTGAAGLVGLWFAGGYVLILTACSFNMGGC